MHKYMILPCIPQILVLEKPVSNFSSDCLLTCRYAPQTMHAGFQKLVNFLFMRSFTGFLWNLWKPVIYVPSVVSMIFR